MTQIKNAVRFLIHSKYGPIICLVIVNLLVGYLVANDFGQSWDEYYNYAAGKRSIQYYQGAMLFSDTGEDYYHGPFYFMVFSITAPIFRALIPDGMTVDGRHFTNFLAFQVAIVSLYFICLRFVSPRIAFLSSLLFTTQPLLFGHAFINQKDIPFMAFFTAAVAVGFYAIDRRGDRDSAAQQTPLPADDTARNPTEEIQADWRGRQVGIRVLYLLVTGIILLLIFDLFREVWVLPALDELLRAAYLGESLPLINQVFARLAAQSSQIPVDAYVNRLEFLFALSRIPTFILLVVLLGAISRLMFPGTFRIWVRPLMRNYGPLILAAALVGITTSTRIIGLFAGALISLYALLALRKRLSISRILSLLLAYWGIALFVTYLTWPALWGDPVTNFRQLLIETARFQEHTVFYLGDYYSSSLLPWHFFSVVTALQLTIPALALFIGGVILAIRGFREQSDNNTLIILALWLALPILADILAVMNVYGNRHLLFVLPPVFAIGSLAWKSLLNRLKWVAAKGLLAGLLILPGVISIITYHPYEYVYYNLLGGGLQGAVGRFQLDYWCTGYREAMEFVNDEAPSEAIIAVWGPLEAASDFARSDLTVVPAGNLPQDTQPQFTLECANSMHDEEYLAQQNIVFEVRNGEARFAIVTQQVP